MEPVTRPVWITGRSHYQEALSELGPGLHKAVLVHEPENPHDPNAVRVDAAGRKIGYIPAAIAAALAPVIDKECPTGAGHARVRVVAPEGKKQWAAKLTHAGIK